MPGFTLYVIKLDTDHKDLKDHKSLKTDFANQSSSFLILFAKFGLKIKLRKKWMCKWDGKAYTNNSLDWQVSHFKIAVETGVFKQGRKNTIVIIIHCLVIVHLHVVFILQNVHLLICSDKSTVQSDLFFWNDISYFY